MQWGEKAAFRSSLDHAARFHHNDFASNRVHDGDVMVNDHAGWIRPESAALVDFAVAPLRARVQPNQETRTDAWLTRTTLIINPTDSS